MEKADALARSWARFPQFWEPRASHDGRWVAWTWTGVTEVGNVWIAPSDGSAAPMRLTDEPDHTYVRSFSHDNRLILLAQSEGSSEHDHLILLDRESGAKRLLTPKQNDHYVFGGAFTKDDSHILYVASYDDAAGKAIEGQRLYLHDLASGDRRMVSAAESLESRPPELNEDGRHVLYHRSDLHPGGSQIWLLDLVSGEDREVLNVGDSRKAYGAWLDRQRILVHAERDRADAVGILDLNDLRVNWLIDNPERSIESVVAGRDGRTVGINDFCLGSLRSSLLDLDSGKERPIAGNGQSHLLIHPLTSETWLAERYSSGAAHELVRYDPGTGSVVNLSRSTEHLSSSNISYGPAKPWRWKSPDGRDIHGWLYEPAGVSRGAIIHVHGGPTWHSEDWINSEIQFLVGIGYTVLDPNYRGSTGSGREFREAIKQDGWGGREQADIRAGIESLIAAGKAAIGRIAVVGLSYGGYSSWYQITKSADLVAAAVPICGMYHLIIDYDKTEMPHGRSYSEEMMGGSPADQPERYHDSSPANFIDRIKGRLMIVHGLKDSNVSPENTWTACRDLDRAGISYELLTFPDEGHGIYRTGNRQVLFERMAKFLEQTFKS